MDSDKAGVEGWEDLVNNNGVPIKVATKHLARRKANDNTQETSNEIQVFITWERALICKCLAGKTYHYLHQKPQMSILRTLSKHIWPVRQMAKNDMKKYAFGNS